MVTGTTDVNTDSDCSRIITPDTAFSYSSGLDVTKGLKRTADHSNLYDPVSGGVGDYGPQDPEFP